MPEQNTPETLEPAATGPQRINAAVLESRKRISRRKLLTVGGGSIGLAALLAACATNGGSGSSPSATTGTGTASPLPTNSSGATVAPTTSASEELIAKLDAIGQCSLNSEETQGPYYFDVDEIRSDVREDRPGLELPLALRVQTADCTPVPNCVVEIWHCDAGGIYSGFETASTGGGGGGTGGGPGGGGGGQPGGDASSGSGETSDGQYSQGVSEATTGDDSTYLRGAQVADENGIVQFTTVWPGWYMGRTVHIHLKVHKGTSSLATDGSSEVLTTQLWFDDTLNTWVFSNVSPYTDHTGRDTMNADDSIIDANGQLTVELDGSTPVLAYANLGVA